MRCSRRSAELRFLRNVGRPIRDEINAVLMDRAAALLRDRSVPVDSLAARLGWRSRAAFRTAFEKFYAMPPLRWRKEHLG
jgi:iron complex transport system substrate-binding protein